MGFAKGREGHNVLDAAEADCLQILVSTPLDHPTRQERLQCKEVREAL